MKPEVHYVYVYVNTVTGHAYVGRTKDLKKRHRDHQSLARKNKGWTFHQAIRDHGIDSFVKLVPFSGTKKDAMDIEVSLIKRLQECGRSFIQRNRWWARHRRGAAARARNNS